MTRPRSFIVPALVMTLMSAALQGASAGPRVPALVADGFGRTFAPKLPSTHRFSYLRRDGNDAKGPLDLAYAQVTRGGSKDLLTWGSRHLVSNKQLDPQNGNFAVAIDTDNNGHFDFYQYAFFAAGRMRGVLVTRRGRVISRSIATSRLGPRTFRQEIEASSIGMPSMYRFVLYSFYQATPCTKKRPCLDVIPNRSPYLPVDRRAPTITGVKVAGHSTDVSADLNSTATFVTHDFEPGTGLKGWKVESRLGGAGSWTTVETGSTREPTVLIPGAEGGRYRVSISSTDKQANTSRLDYYWTLFPFDDKTGSPMRWGLRRRHRGRF